MLNNLKNKTTLISEFEEELNKQAKLMIPNKKFACILSGGIDSTLVLSLIRKIRPDIDIHAVSIKFADSIDETTDASKIAETFNAEHHIIHLENYLSELPKAISMIRMPFWDIHWYYIAKNAKKMINS